MLQFWKINGEVLESVDINHFKTHNGDYRWQNIIELYEKHNSKHNIALIVNENKIETIVPYLDYKFKSFDRVIIYQAELFWSEFNNSEYLEKLLKDVDLPIEIIWNFFCDDPFDLDIPQYITTGVCSQITRLYLNKYEYPKLKDSWKDIKYNLISKFGRPNRQRIKLYNKLKNYDKFICSMNNFEYFEDFNENRVLPSEKGKDGDFKSWELADEDFQSICSLVVETRTSQFENSSRLVTCSEKTLKSFITRRPSILVIQPEAFGWLEKRGFRFFDFFVEKNLETICKMDTKELFDLAVSYEYIWENNLQVLRDLIQKDSNKLEEIING